MDLERIAAASLVAVVIALVPGAALATALLAIFLVPSAAEPEAVAGGPERATALPSPTR